MAIIKYVGTNTDGLYSDGDQVETDIFEYVKTVPQSEYQTVFQKDQRWPVFYHLSEMRENILNWYDFKPNCSILEIGGEMGALTGLLCRKAKSVTTVELTRRRAEIIHSRHTQCDNLTILVGNFNEIEFSEKFDYITLIGVLEYAKGFSKDGSAESFLEKIQGLLKSDGKLLIGIENRFGMKYWCGANEDHVDAPYIGINGYPGVQNVQTYSRQECIDLLKKCGLKKCRFYYPMPDYKFPQIMYSDDYLPKDKLPNKIVQYYLNDPQIIADEAKLYDAAIQNDAFPFFANSFFIECGKNKATLSNISFASFTPGRKPIYNVVTIIRKDGTVEKIAAAPRATKHLDTIYKNQQKYLGGNLVSYRKLEDRLEMDYISARSLEAVLLDCLKARKLTEAKAWFDLLYDSIKKSAKVEKAGDDPLLRYGFLDMIPSNCFIVENELVFFDQEWLADNMPASFLLFRAIRTFFMENAEVEREIPMAAVLALYFPDTAILTKYEEIERKIQEKVSPPCLHSLAYLYRNTVPVDFQVFSRARKKLNVACCFFNMGNGYSEEKKQLIYFEPEKPFSAMIPVPAGTVSIRFDPVENHFSIVNGISIISDAGILHYKCLNGKERNGLFLFQTPDPQIEVYTTIPIQWMKIQANIFCFDSFEVLLLFDMYFGMETNYEDAKKEVEHLIAQRSDTDVTLREMEAEYGELQEALSWTEAEKSSLKETLTQMEAQCGELQEALSRTEAEKSSLKETLTQMEAQCGELQKRLARKEAEQVELKETLTRAEAENENRLITLKEALDQQKTEKSWQRTTFRKS